MRIQEPSEIGGACCFFWCLDKPKIEKVVLVQNPSSSLSLSFLCKPKIEKHWKIGISTKLKISLVPGTATKRLSIKHDLGQEPKQ